MQSITLRSFNRKVELLLKCHQENKAVLRRLPKFISRKVWQNKIMFVILRTINIG